MNLIHGLKIVNCLEVIFGLHFLDIAFLFFSWELYLTFRIFFIKKLLNKSGSNKM
jgi:hypothetical protein